MSEVPALLTGGVPADPGRPLLTFYDDATGERTELTATALAGWAARTAALLHDGCGLGTGSRAAVLLPPHWQTAAVLLGAWSAGLSVSYRPAATAGLPEVGPGSDKPLDVTFAARYRVDDWLDDVPDAPHRFVLFGEPPDGYRDFLAEACRYPGSLPGYALVRPTDPATVDGTTYEEWGRLAQSLVEAQDLRGGDRLLIDAGAHDHPVRWLLAPLSVGASVVLCANLDPAAVPARVASERVTRVL